MASPDKLVNRGIPIPPLPEGPNPVRPYNFLDHQPLEYYSLPGAKAEVQAAIGKKLGVDLKTVLVEEPPVSVGADLAVPCFPFAKTLRKNPAEIAGSLAESVTAIPDVPLTAQSEKGFLNMALDRSKFANEVVRDVEEMGDKYGWINKGEGKTVVIDYSSPNIAKFMGVAHLRSTVIGNSLANIYEAGGYEVVRDNHLGDWGTQFGMLGRAHELWSGEFPDLKEGGNAVSGLYGLYVKMHDEIDKEKKPLEAPIKAKMELVTDKKGPEYLALKRELDGVETSLEREGKAWFKRLEEGDPKARELLEWSTTLSKAEFKRIYDLLGVKFNYELGESQFFGMVPDVIRQFQEVGVARKGTAEDEKRKGTYEGSLLIDLADKGLDKLVIQKSDGTSVYATRDLATLAAREAWFNPDKILYVVGGEQTDYFRQVFAAYDKFAQGEGPELEHIAFGKLSLPSGEKMSTRRGNVIFLEDVLREAISKAHSKIDGAGRSMTPAERLQVAEQVGVGAMTYFDLGQGRERGITFDFDKALDLAGQSAPFIQYAHARTQAILERAGQQGITADRDTDLEITTDTEHQLTMQLARFPESIARAIEGNQPSSVAEHAYRLADAFNTFYSKDKVLTEDEVARNTRLRLTAAAGTVIKNGLGLLGIQAPAKM